jgi:hypothetical protein
LGHKIIYYCISKVVTKTRGAFLFFSLTFFLGLVTQETLTGQLICKEFAVSNDGRVCEASYNFLTVFAGGGTSTSVKIEGKNLSSEGWALTPSAPKSSDGWWIQPNVEYGVFFQGENSPLVQRIGYGVADGQGFPQSSALVKLTIDIVAPLKGCDIHGQNCENKGDPTLFSSSSLALVVRAKNPDDLRVAPAPTLTLSVAGTKFQELPALLGTSIMTSATLGPDKRVILAFGSEENEDAPLILKIVLTDDIGELGTRLVTVPSYGGTIGFDPSDQNLGLISSDRIVINGTLTVKPVSNGKKFFVSGWSLDSRGFIPLSSIKSAPLPVASPEKE